MLNMFPAAHRAHIVNALKRTQSTDASHALDVIFTCSSKAADAAALMSAVFVLSQQQLPAEWPFIHDTHRELLLSHTALFVELWVLYSVLNMHLLWFIAAFLFSCLIWRSFSTTCIKIVFGLYRGLSTSTS